MDPITRPIRAVYDTKSTSYRTKTWLAYLGVFGVACGDTLRYSVGWLGMGIWSGIMFIATVIMLVRSRPMATIRRIPWPLIALYASLFLSSLLSDYRLFSIGAVLVSLATASFGLWLAHDFDWRHLLRVFTNVLRFVLASSLVFELIVASLHIRVLPIFKNFTGTVVPAKAYYWSQGNLFNGDRIQGIVGNSNLLAYLAMIGLIVFAVEFAILGTSRWISVSSLVTAGLCMALSKSAGIGFALVAVVVSAVVSIAAEGKPQDTRHRYYRVALTAAGSLGVILLTYRAELFNLIGKSPDMTGRTMIWKKVLGLIFDRPLSGYGWLSYWMPGVKPYEGLVVINKVAYYQAHNAFLDMWLQGGILALIFFIILVVFTFVRLWQLAVRHTSALYLWPILVFIGLVVQNFTESRLLSELGWVLLTLFVIKVREPNDLLEPLGRSTKRVRLLGRGLRRNQSQPRKDR
ncbi:MAG: O-antigen ligase family protein [Microbacteriaceae bacterium]|nr:O-antigen ligase family protein [Microbacteriaceae bacterium]